MIRPLRRRHQWILRALLLMLFAAAMLAVLHPAPEGRMEHLPPEIRADATSDATR